MVQRPRTTRTNAILDAFGSSDEPAPAPEAPATGEPLLNDLELNGANQFFERFQNDTSLFDDPKAFESFDPFSHEPLSSFQGVSSSLGHPLLDSTSPVHTLDFASFGAGDLTSRLGQTQLSSPTNNEFSSSQNLNAISQITYPIPVNNQPRPPRAQSDLFSSQEFFPVPKHVRSRSSFGQHSVPNRGHEKPALSERNVGPVRRGSVGYDSAQAHSSDTGANSRRAMPVVSFGSDSDFAGHKYVAPGSALKDLKSCEAKFQSNLETFESKWDGEPQPDQDSTVRRRLSTSQNHAARQVKQDIQEERDVKSTKKLKRSRQEEDSEDTSDGSEDRVGPKSKAQNKARTYSEGGGGTSSAASRRKSTLAEVKAPRQNLTEEEKKLNHIRSEQKRRNQIKEGFANLTEMMPDKTIGASKCAILSSAVDWLADLIEGNEALRAQLEKMGGRL